MCLVFRVTEAGGHELEAVGGRLPSSVKICFQQERMKPGRTVWSGDEREDGGEGVRVAPDSSKSLKSSSFSPSDSVNLQGLSNIPP